MPRKDRFGAQLAPESHRRLLPLGLIGPDEDAEEAITSAFDNPEDAVTFLRRHRVVGLGMRRLKAKGPLPAELQALYDFHKALDAILKTALDDVVKVAQSCGTSVAGIKGLSMRTAYDFPSDRDTGDVDVMCNNVDDAWQIVSALRDRGYDWCQYEWPWIKRDRDSGRLYGQFQVWQQLGDVDKRVDVHFAGYSVRHSRLADVCVDQPGFSIMSPEQNLPCLMGNAAGDFLVRLKDVNDVRMLRRSGVTSLGPERDQLRSVGLHTFWDHLEALAESPTSTPSARWWEAAFTDRAAAFEISEKRRRVLATVRDAFIEGARRGGPLNGLRAAGAALDYYRRDLHVSIRPCQHRANPELIARMTNETCVRLIPTRRIADAPRLEGLASVPTTHLSVPASPIAGSVVFQERRIGVHSLITADDEVFIPTVLYDVCEFLGSVSHVTA